MIDQPTIDRILDAANIVDVVSEFVTLRKRGSTMQDYARFIRTNHRLLRIPSKNICKCFACGEGGTAVHFIMKHEQLSYFDALRFLAKNTIQRYRNGNLPRRETNPQRPGKVCLSSIVGRGNTSLLYYMSMLKGKAQVCATSPSEDYGKISSVNSARVQLGPAGCLIQGRYPSRL